MGETSLSSTDGHHVLALNRVYSYNLAEDKCWFALYKDLCGTKSSLFCATEAAKAFPDEYKRVKLEELRDENGNHAFKRWFNNHHRSEEVFVASAFGLVAALLRGKSLHKLSFLKSVYFQEFVEALNKRGFSSSVENELSACREEVNRYKTRVKVLEAQIASTAQELQELHTKVTYTIPSPPTTPTRQNPDRKAHQSKMTSFCSLCVIRGGFKK